MLVFQNSEALPKRYFVGKQNRLLWASILIKYMYKTIDSLNIDSIRLNSCSDVCAMYSGCAKNVTQKLYKVLLCSERADLGFAILQ